jgi:hypothetical protein
MTELETRIEAMAVEYQHVISALTRRCAQMAADNAVLQTKLKQLEEPEKTDGDAIA